MRYPNLFKSKYPRLQGKDWINWVDKEDMQVFVSIGMEANLHGQLGGQSTYTKHGRDHMAQIGRIGAIITNSKKLWNRLLEEEMYKEGLLG